MNVTIPKSTRSCFVMYASSSSAGRPGMACANGTNDSFFLLPEYAVDDVVSDHKTDNDGEVHTRGDWGRFSDQE